MSKFLALVLTPLYATNIVELVGQLLAPYKENEEEDNPIAKMDYWMIGGVYDGVLTGGPSRLEVLNQTSPSGGHLTGRRIPSDQDDEEWLANNQIAVAALPPVAEWDEHVGAYAVVTPDGHWHELSERTPTGYVRKQGYLQQVLDQHQDCWAIAVMCHA